MGNMTVYDCKYVCGNLDDIELCVFYCVTNRNGNHDDNYPLVI